MGYKIYAGSIGHYVDNNNDVWDDQMIWVEHALIHDSMGDAISDEQRPCIEDGTVSLENLAIPQFSFTVPKSWCASWAEVLKTRITSISN